MSTTRHLPLLAPLVAVGVLTAACGSSTESPDPVAATTDSIDAADGGDRLETNDTVTATDPITTGAQAPGNEATGNETTVPSITQAPTADPATTDSLDDPAATGPAADAPDDAVATPTQAADGVAVVYGGSGTAFPWAPLGWWDGSQWVPAGFADDGSVIVAPDPSYESVSATSVDLPDGPGAVIDGLSLGIDGFYCVGDETGPVIDIGIELPSTDVSLGYDAIAVTADWPLQPRPVSQVGIENPDYADVGAALFSDAPTAGEGSVVQAIRADLDGDGIEEVLVTYERITEPNFGAENDFTGVYARYPEADGTVVDELVAGYVLIDPIDYPTVGRYTIAAVADLNGDGVMEVAIRNTFWESAGISVFALEGGQLVQIFGGGCGV